MSSFSLVRSPSLLLADDLGLPSGTFLCHNLSIFLCHQPLVYVPWWDFCWVVKSFLFLLASCYYE